MDEALSVESRPGRRRSGVATRPVCFDPDEMAKKAYTRVLKALEEPGTQAKLAVAMRKSESAISGIKTERLEVCIEFLAYAGFKVLPMETKCLTPQAYEFLTSLHRKIAETHPDMIWELDA